MIFYQRLFFLIPLFIIGFYLFYNHSDAKAPSIHALLIGVDHYEFLEPKDQLKGPKNDVLLLANVLRDKGFNKDQIKILSSDYIKPTKKNIIENLNQLVNKTKSGDFVLLYFSGHGSQQTDFSQTEADNYDEIFLPADTKNWNSKTKKVENALLDNEINTYIQKFRKNNVFVWLIIDSCHSGTMVKDPLPADSGIKYRFVSPSDLNVPKISNPLADIIRPYPLYNKNNRTGGLIAFYASQSYEKTLEKKFNDPIIPFVKKTYGLFTYSLVKLLKDKDLTYQQLALQLFSEYQKIPWSRSTPLIQIQNGLENCIPPNIKNCNFPKNAPFFPLKIAVLGEKNPLIMELIKKIKIKIPVLEIVEENKSALNLVIDKKGLWLKPKQNIFSKNLILLENLEQELLVYLMRYSKINALFKTFKKHFNHTNNEFLFSIKLKKDNTLIQKNQMTSVYNNDEIEIKLKNLSTENKDITLFLIDSQYYINLIVPRSNGINRIEGLGEQSEPAIINNSTLGSEVLLLFSSKGTAQEMVQNFKFLATDPKIEPQSLDDDIKIMTMKEYLKQHIIKQVDYSIEKLELQYLNWDVK